MNGAIATTPFGGAPFRAARFVIEKQLEAARQKADAGGSNATAPVDKFRLVTALGTARACFSLSDRTVSVLMALVSVHPAREIVCTAPQIVFPSNRELSRRTNGMADATLRRHIAALVAAGLVLRRDSPNGKRYCRRGEGGMVSDAFGFDLAPLALQAGTIFAAAEAVEAEERSIRLKREEISLHRRDVSKIIEAALGEGRGQPAAWAAFLDRLAAMPLPRRTSDQTTLTALCDALVRLRAEVEKAWLDTMTDKEMSANDIEIERHYPNSKADSHLEKGSEKELNGNDTEKTGAVEGRKETGNVQDARPEIPIHERKGLSVPLDRLLSACPQIRDYARDGIANWRDLLATANLVRSMLGVSPDAWEKARQAMGEHQAGAVIACMLERAEAIRSPGGYLRSLTEKAESGHFSVLRMIEALE